MGRDFNKNSIDCYNQFPSKEKTLLCWANFSIKPKNPCNRVRSKFLENIENKEWIKFDIRDERNSKKKYSVVTDNKTIVTDFFKQLNKTKFVLCPKGFGIESYRFYDSLYSGAIPIVIKDGILYDKFKHLPVLVFKNMKELKKLTPEYLEKQYEILSKKFKTYQPLLDMNHWLKSICDHKKYKQ